MKFTGELAESIRVEYRSVTLLTNTPEGRAEVDKHNGQEVLRSLAEQLKKLPLLENALGLDGNKYDATTRFTILAFALAREFVPGFRIKNVSTERERGRKKDWDAIKYCQLFADVQIVLKDKPRSESEACNVLVKSPRFKKRWGSLSAATLKNRLVFAKDEKKNVMMTLINKARDSKIFDEIGFIEMMIGCFGITENGN